MVIGLSVAALIIAVVVYDVTQRRHAIIRNFPIIGHFRYILETIGPELRQYIVTDNDQERPFSRDQRRWVYSTAKKQNSYFGFGTDNDLDLSPNYVIFKQAAFPLASPNGGDDPGFPLPCAKVLGGRRKRRQAFRPASVVNISGMSYGSLSRNAVEAINRGAAQADCLHNTGEGGVADCHLAGGELIWQVGTGYFGCRDERGGFDLGRFKDAVASHPIRAVEVKLSQGAKPGLGGVLPAAKITAEIAQIRGIPMGKTCISPNSHSAFRDVDSMLDFVEMLAEETGVPVGIKSAVGEQAFWVDLARLMAETNRGVDFVVVDGGEGGTGAAPLAFSDHVALPFKLAFPRVYREFAQRGIQDHVVFAGSGRLGFPETALFAMAMGCDLIHLGREAMMAVGCIQAQKCHTGHCPTGVATQNWWLMRGLDVEGKAERLANYIIAMRKELTLLSRACGVEHPAMVGPQHIELLNGAMGSRPAHEVLGYEPHWGTTIEPLL